MSGLDWGPSEEARLAAIRDDLASVSTATACQLLIALGWRNAYMLGLRPLQPLGLGTRLVGRARTCRYLMRRGPEGPHDPVARRISPEIVLIESIEPGDVFCVDALGVPTAGIIGDILSARILRPMARLAAVIHGAVRDAPFITEVGLPVFAATSIPRTAAATSSPSITTGRSTWPGAQVLPGDVILADDEGALAMPLDLAEYIAAHGPAERAAGDLDPGQDRRRRLDPRLLPAESGEGGGVHDAKPGAKRRQSTRGETGGLE